MADKPLTKEQKEALIAEAEAKKKAKEAAEKNGGGEADAEEEDENAGTDGDENADGEGDESEDEAGNQGKDKNIDYEKELELERERREKAEKALAERNFKERQKKRAKKDKDDEEQGDEDEGDEDEKPLTQRQLREILAADRQRTQKEVQANQIAEKARKLASSDAEAALIIEIHKNRNFPEHLTLDEQIEEAFAIANRKRLLAQNEELKRALKSKETKKTDAAGSHKDTPAKGEPKLAAQDLQAIKRSGFVWDASRNLYKKALKGSNKTLFYDPKSKKRFVEANK